MVEAPDIESLSFEQALAELEGIVAKLESGQAPLEQSIQMYERGALLKAHCEKRLEAARLRVEKIVMGQGGPQGVEPAEFG
ncbi:MAG: exodeoxyribonuclease VII small subunit [Phenylobacterium sp.]|jgi:exodeoxyribonuclease VII small subunit|uniref:exodeoxyribonuclease VII small subunit n=1 Tax=Phenylobacterium sp. TaxID=1871053 RepID=UPI002A337860|nr:exodeoxyribonuclease VII small subunit [Phenylobacterium sp.]MDD3836477.1 exodeoxyribonuclease VII small subunit [Phenylobacterium sp.]MDX9997697.1 exodeoxyribonuclease VII small subunit [Phenylobacterium sp.]